MSTTNTTTYGAVSRFNHWIIATAMLGMLAFGLFLENIELTRETKGMLIGIHKSVGVLFLIFALWRVAFRIVRGFPAPVAAMASWQEVAAKGAHWALLAGILIMPISGLVMSLYGGHPVDFFGIFSIPAREKVDAIAFAAKATHGIVANLIILLIAVHFAATLKHHFIDRDLTLSRMLGQRTINQEA